MKTVRKNISSLWKARKERLSEILKKRLRKSERNCRNLAKERKSLFSKLNKEVKTYAKGGIILSDNQADKNLELIEFDFGDEKVVELEKKSVRSNNWLKLHGLPMRRKGKGRKRVYYGK